MKDFLLEPYDGSDLSYTYTTSIPVHGLFIHNFDDTNSLTFTVHGISLPLKANQGTTLPFNNPFNEVTITNDNACLFLIGGIV